MAKRSTRLSSSTLKTLSKIKGKDTLIPFIGAGFTTNIHPGATFQRLLEDCVKRAFGGNQDLLGVCDNDSARAIDFVIWKLGENARGLHALMDDAKYRHGKLKFHKIVNDFLVGLQVQGYKPQKSDLQWRQHRALVRCFEVIITTNWDNTIESAGEAEKYFCQAHYSVNRELFAETFGDKMHKKRRIIKFHGHLTNKTTGTTRTRSAGSLVASETDYYRRMRHSDPLDDELICQLASNGLLFIGYSLKDVNVRYVLKQVNTVNRYFARVHKSFWVITEPMPDNSDKSSQLYRQFLEDDANIKICPLIEWSPTDEKGWRNCISPGSKAQWLLERKELIRDAWSQLFDGLSGESVS